MTDLKICHWCGCPVDKSGMWELHVAYIGPFEGVHTSVCYDCSQYIDAHMADRALKAKEAGNWPMR